MAYDVDMKVTTIHGFTAPPEVEEGQEVPPCDCTVVLTRDGSKVELTINDYDVAGRFAQTVEDDEAVTITFQV